MQLEAPPIPGPNRPLHDIEGYVWVRRKFFGARRRQYLKLNGSVLSGQADYFEAVSDWTICLLQSSIEQSARKCTITISFSNSTVKLYLLFESQTDITRWAIALQMASTRDFQSLYHVKDKIGEGGFATVHRATCLTTGRSVAVKCVKRRDFDVVTARELDREMFAMKYLRHPHIVCAHEVFNTRECVFIIMDYMRGGTMKDCVQAAGGRISETRAKRVVRQILEACAFLHSHGYVHRDVKLENVLVCDSDNDRRDKSTQRQQRYFNNITNDVNLHHHQQDRCKLADFGYVNFVEDPRHPCLRSLLGTPVYIAPEIIRRQPYGPPVDVYATGVMLYRMISGHYPYDGREDDDKTLELAVEGKLTFGDFAWRKTSRKCRSLVRALLQPDPARRLTARTALLHPWLDSEDQTSTNRTSHSNTRTRHEQQQTLNNGNRRGEAKNSNNGVSNNRAEKVLTASPVTPSHGTPGKLTRQVSSPVIIASQEQPHQQLQTTDKVVSFGVSGTPVIKRKSRIDLNNKTSRSSVPHQNATNSTFGTPGIMRKSASGVGTRMIDMNTNDDIFRGSGNSGEGESSELSTDDSSEVVGRRNNVVDVEAVRWRVKKAIWVVTFITKLGVIAGTRMPVRRMTTNRQAQTQTSHVTIADEREDGVDEDGTDTDLDGDDTTAARAGRKESKRKSAGRTSYAGVTRRFGRASSFSRPGAERSRRIGTFGERLRRTMTMGRR